MKYEIDEMTKLMNKDDFYPKNFAYPFGDVSTELDKLLLTKFNSVRKIISPYGTKKLADMDALYYKYDGIKLFYGTNIDKRNVNTIDDVLSGLKAAKKRREALSIYCHFISKEPIPFVDDSYIIEADFFKIVELAKQLNLKFYTVAEVSRNTY
ncbi:MAG: hypothetical protein ACK4K9_03630 [Bacteroidia bacterium]